LLVVVQVGIQLVVELVEVVQVVIVHQVLGHHH
jgi:hypothetical protein